MQVWIVNPWDNLTLDGPFTGRYETLVNHLLAAGHQVEWFLSNWNHAEKRLRRFGTGRIQVNPSFTVHSIPAQPYHRNLSPARFLSHRDYAAGLVRAFQESPGRPDLMVASLPLREALARALDYAKPRNIPVVVDVQDLWPEALPLLVPSGLRFLVSPVTGLTRWLEDRTIRRASAVFAVCEAYEQRGLEAFPDPSTVPAGFEYIGVDLDRFDAITGEYVPEDGDRRPYLIFVGMLGAMADLELALAAAQQVKASGPLPLLRIFGEGPELSRLQSLARELNLPEVIFHGRRQWEECMRALRGAVAGLNIYLKAADKFPNNAMGNKVFEYMAAGLPVINSVPGELGELIAKRELGWNFLAGDPASLARAIREAAADPEEGRRRGRAARRFAEEKADRKTSYPRYVKFLEAAAKK